MNIKFQLTDNLFRWKAVSNGLSPVNHEVFSLSVSDPCHPAVHFQLHVDVLPCPCLNGGSCAVQYHHGQHDWSSNQIHQSYRCQCPPGFSGPDCGQRIDSPCEPNNPCQNGGQCSTLSNQTVGYSCQCVKGYQGINCDKSSSFNITSTDKNMTLGRP